MKKLLATATMIISSVSPAFATCLSGWCDNTSIDYLYIKGSNGWVYIKLNEPLTSLECGAGVGQPKDYITLKVVTGSERIYAALLSAYLSEKPLKRVRIVNSSADCDVDYIFN